MHCNGCMNVAWDWCWGGSRSTKHRIFFRVKWLRRWRAARVGGGYGPFVLTCDWFLQGVLQRAVANLMVVAAWMWTWCCKTPCSGCIKVPRCCGYLRNTTIVFCSWALQVLVAWPHQGCNSASLADSHNFGACDLPWKIPCKKRFEIRFWSCNFWCRCA